MKTKSLITAILLFVTFTGFAQDKVFDKLVDNKDITQVIVTKALLKMLPSMISSVDMNMNGMDIKSIINKLDQVNIFTSDNSAAKKLMRKEITTHLKNDKSYEILMKIKDKEDDVTFFGQKDGAFIKSLVMFVDGGEGSNNECVIIQLLGKFTMEDIQNVMDKGK
jgi:hypothetical protein